VVPADELFRLFGDAEAGYWRLMLALVDVEEWCDDGGVLGKIILSLR